MKSTPRFAIRTIRHGRVKIGGKWFAPDENFMKYDGRLDGMRYAFGRYWTGDVAEPFVSLWGTEAYKKGLTDDPRGVGTEYEDLSYVEHEDGHVFFPWVWWREIEDGKRIQARPELPEAARGIYK